MRYQIIFIEINNHLNQYAQGHLSTHIPHVVLCLSLINPSSPQAVPQAFLIFQYVEVAPTK